MAFISLGLPKSGGPHIVNLINFVYDFVILATEILVLYNLGSAAEVRLGPTLLVSFGAHAILVTPRVRSVLKSLALRRLETV